MTLRPRIRRVRRRFCMIGTCAALAWALVAALLLLLSAVWLDLVWEMSPQARIAATVLAAAAGLVVLAAAVAATLRSATDRRIARRIDRAGRLGGRVVTGLDLERCTTDAAAEQLAPLTAGLAQIAVQHAVETARGVRAADAVPARPLRRAAGVLVSLVVLVGLLAVCMPRLARTQLRRFLHPAADVPPFSLLVLLVEPGDVEVQYGSPLEIRAQVAGGTADHLELVLLRQRGGREVLPMFPETADRWRTVLAEVTAPAEYHVRAGRARSSAYRIRVLTVPRIEQVRLRLTPPAYTGLGVYEGPVPAEGIAGLPGTRVELRAKSNRLLSGGTLLIHPAERPSGPSADDNAAGADNPAAEQIAAPFSLAMQPTGKGADEVLGEFAISGDGKLELWVVDVEGQRSKETFTATITQLKDQRPFIRLTDPPTRSLATPEATLPVTLSAEDDYGISRVQLFRSLNDSRPLPADFDPGQKLRRRADEFVDLPLSAYGLQPGDVIRLFGRVEDNDPAGAKGWESAVAVVEIISQEDFERMLQMREGLETLMSKYREARRRMEGAGEDVERLRSKSRQRPPGEPLDLEMRQEADRVLRRLRRESEAIKRLSQHKLPFDLDKALASQLGAAAEMTERMAEELEKLLNQADANHQALARQLEKMAQELSGGLARFDREAMIPLETLEAIFPLVADQARFVMLALRQIDLAERLASLKGRGGEDNPALKGRMRDLEEEQRAIRQSLDELLLEIKNHVEQLPEDEKLDPLRQTALKFVDDVRGSGVLGVMAEAETALAEFSGTRAHQKAQEAADIMRRFLKECQSGGMGSMACDCLIFQPSLGAGLGNTVAQLLAAMGLSGGSGGFAAGSGGMGGFSAMPGGALGNVGLFGTLGGMDRSSGSPREESEGRELVGDGQPREGVNPDLARDPGADQPAWSAEAGGMGEAVVPLRYRHRVGEYFRRLAEELGGP